MRSLAGVGAKIERLAAHTQGRLSDEDRAHILAWQARVAERWQGGPPPTDAQLALLAKPGFWQRLQRAWARPAFSTASRPWSRRSAPGSRRRASDRHGRQPLNRAAAPVR
jgi:hypothetical protein